MKFKDFFFCLSQIKDPYISQLESQEKLDEDDQEKEEEDGKNIGPVNFETIELIVYSSKYQYTV